MAWYPVSGAIVSRVKTLVTRPASLCTRARCPSLTAMPAASCPRCCNANNPKNASSATPSPCGVEMPSTPHSSLGLEGLGFDDGERTNTGVVKGSPLLSGWRRCARRPGTSRARTAPRSGARRRRCSAPTSRPTRRRRASAPGRRRGSRSRRRPAGRPPCRGSRVPPRRRAGRRSVSAIHHRDESGVWTSSISISESSDARPNSYFVSARISPASRPRTLPRWNTSTAAAITRSHSSASRSPRVTTSSHVIGSSWPPCSAFVVGVTIASGSGVFLASPSGKRWP